MKKTVIIFLSILIIFMCPLNVSVQAQDYSKLNGEIYEKFESMQEGDKASVLLYLSYDNTESSTENFYKDIEAANNDFLGRYPSIAVENVYYVSKLRSLLTNMNFPDFLMIRKLSASLISIRNLSFQVV